MAYTYTTEPHPTCKGKLLAVAPKCDSWRCTTYTENAFIAIGGKHWRGHQEADSIAYTLSPSQARDLDLILRGGFHPDNFNATAIVEKGDAVFWHPDHPGREFSRAEALDALALPHRCARTAEMDLAPPIPVASDATPTVDEALAAKPDYEISEARYAKGKLVIRTTENDGYKSRACRLAADGLGLHYVGRSNGYTASQAQAERFERLYAAGFDASYITGAIDHWDKGLKDLTWRDADKLAKQWGKIASPEAAQSESAPEAVQVVPEAVEALSGPEIGLGDISDDSGNIPAPDPIDQLAARLAAVEALLATLPAVSGQGAIPVSQDRPKRTAAHERAIRRAWAERRTARLQRAIAADQMRMREQVQVDLRKLSADLATLRPQYDNAAKARHSFMLEMDRACESERIALRKRRRAVLLARDLMKRLNAEHRLVDRYIAEKRELATNLRHAEECLEAAQREPAEIRAATQFLHARAASESLLLMQARAETERQGRERAETALAALQARFDGWPPAVRRVTVNMAA